MKKHVNVSIVIKVYKTSGIGIGSDCEEVEFFSNNTQGIIHINTAIVTKVFPILLQELYFLFIRVTTFYLIFIKVFKHTGE